MAIINENTQDNDVNIYDSQINILIYTNNLILVSNTALGLQDKLDIVYDYCNKWKLNGICLNRTLWYAIRVAEDLEMKYGDQILNVCDTYNYLGISFTSGGITNTTLNVLRNQAKKSLNILNVKVKKLGDFPPAVKLRLFHVSIVPILLYSSEVWGYMEASTHQVHVVLNKWCKCILGVKDSTDNAADAGELGQFPLMIDIP